MSVQLTSDGTHTIHSEEYGVPYHSIHGALQETNHVFIDAGLRHIAANKKQIRILECGFGTGLNVIATIAASKEHGYSIDYHTIEAYPISLNEVSQLNYADHLTGINHSDLTALHTCEWAMKIELQPSFYFTKYRSKIQDFKSTDLYDLIYFDAFAPTAQPELWEPIVLRKMYDLLESEGVLVTYCAKGQFKRDLRSVGFEVEALPGPPGKREMTRARKVS